MENIDESKKMPLSGSLIAAFVVAWFVAIPAIIFTRDIFLGVGLGVGVFLVIFLYTRMSPNYVFFSRQALFEYIAGPGSKENEDKEAQESADIEEKLMFEQDPVLPANVIDLTRLFFADSKFVFKSQANTTKNGCEIHYGYLIRRNPFAEGRIRRKYKPCEYFDSWLLLKTKKNYPVCYATQYPFEPMLLGTDANYHFLSSSITDSNGKKWTLKHQSSYDVNSIIPMIMPLLDILSRAGHTSRVFVSGNIVLVDCFILNLKSQEEVQQFVSELVNSANSV